MELRLGSRYELDDVLGRGGSGEVWRATSPEGPVAIKILRPELSNDPDIVERFVAERSLLLGVKSEHVVGVRDLVIEGDRLAIVMDLVQGGDLRTRLRTERTLRPAAAVELMTQVLDGLAEVHASGIVHRDLKPENLLLDDEWNIRVADFGIARLSSGTRATRTTGLLGTPRYVAPELSIRGRVTPAVDVYAAGVTLYEMLFGRVPFDGPHPAAVLRAHAEDLPYRPEGVPDPLWSLIAQMLEKNPQDRPTAVEAAAQLRALAPSVRDADRFPPMARSGGPDTDDTYTTDPHGNATDLTGIGRRGPLTAASGPISRPPQRHRRAALVAVTIGLVVALGAVFFATRDEGAPIAAPYVFNERHPQGLTRTSHDWAFTSTKGNAVDATMRVVPTKAKTFGKQADVLAVFPTEFTHLEFDRDTAATKTFADATAGKSASTHVTAVLFHLPAGDSSFSVSYRAQVPPTGTADERFDQWTVEFPRAYAALCAGSEAPSICPGDRPEAIEFASPSAPAIGPAQEFDASLFLQGRTTSGLTIPPGGVSGSVFSGDNPSVATVTPAGKVRGIAAGEVHILARLGKLTTPTSLTLPIAGAPVSVVTRLDITGEAKISGPSQYVAHGYAADGTEEPVLVAWSVSPSTVGSIDKAGVFTPTSSNHSALITATTVNARGQVLSGRLRISTAVVDPDPDNDSVLGSDDWCPLVKGSPSDHGCVPVAPPVIVDPPSQPTSPPPTSPPPTSPPPTSPPPTSPPPTSPPPVDKPDLIVTAIEPVGTLQAGQCVKFAVTIKNIGPGASPNVKHGILLYVDGGRSTMPWSDNYSQGLAPGESRTQVTNAGRGDTACDASGSMWRAVAGAHTIQAWVDDHEGKSGNGLIDEVTGDNNRLSVAMTVAW